MTAVHYRKCKHYAYLHNYVAHSCPKTKIRLCDFAYALLWTADALQICENKHTPPALKERVKKKNLIMQTSKVTDPEPVLNNITTSLVIGFFIYLLIQWPSDDFFSLSYDT